MNTSLSLGFVQAGIAELLQIVESPAVRLERDKFLDDALLVRTDTVVGVSLPIDKNVQPTVREVTGNLEHGLFESLGLPPVDVMVTYAALGGEWLRCRIEQLAVVVTNPKLTSSVVSSPV